MENIGENEVEKRKESAPKVRGGKILEMEDFQYLDEARLPVLVLGMYIPQENFARDIFPAKDYNFKPGREWLKIAHQTGGVGCCQDYIIGTIITPKPHTVQWMEKLSRAWLNTNAGIVGTDLNTLTQYNADLYTYFGAGCNQSHKFFREGIYPIDLEHIHRLTDEEFNVPALDELIVWENGWERMCGSIGRWNLFILGENSD